MKFSVGPVVVDVKVVEPSGWLADVLRDVRPALRWMCLAAPVAVSVGAALGWA